MAPPISSRGLTWQDREDLARLAMARAVHTRFEAGFEHDNPVPAWVLAERLGVPVRFVDIDFEGMYRREPSPRIVVSVQRPLARRNYTCGHELGHHIFGHGASLEALNDRAADGDRENPDEVLANSFAAHLLMPVLGIRAAFARRGTSPHIATPETFLAVATEYGVGFETLINQVTYAFKELTERGRNDLLGGYQALRQALVPDNQLGPIALVDRHTRTPTLDIEVGHLVIAPADASPDDPALTLISATNDGRVYQATHRSALEISDTRKNWCVTIRIAPKNFVGLARYRFLADDTDDD